MRAARQHMNPLGVAHGGSLGALADSALGLGCHLASAGVNPRSAHDAVTRGAFAVMNLSMDLLAPVLEGDTLLATARQVHGGRRTQSWTVDIVRNADERLVCTARGIALNLSEKNAEDTVGSKRNAEERKGFEEPVLKKMGEGFQMQRMDKSEIEKRFDKLSERWESYVEKLGYVPVFRWLEKCAQSFQPARDRGGSRVDVLDLACGIGLIAKCVTSNLGGGRLPARATGVDISTGMLAKALHAGVYNGGVVQHDLEQSFPLDTASYDLVTFCGASELLDMSLVMPEITRVTRPLGKLWATFQYHDENLPNPTEHQSIVGMTREEVEKLLTTHGFAVDDCTLEPRAFVTPQPGDTT
eukprot:CAMPEP_0114614108 /NCGR_PEP_ID=MMETSP0168-20121206/5479_1 /TAXON_ID=95228 ORGANISM="Vannella sp., Strain DIVA3 517/6/12" /NCGR_SAMPLE_ID=MMETSP0168 /ASSEMBLY_ACC=CAM_ASM_000044 /LENGTH=355 /DNA_ID=CAMNT_0001825137 /DNA_START=265 /DNA_END=1329 /DNA_ORIENTATION=+